MGTPGDRQKLNAISDPSQLEELDDLQDLDLEDHCLLNNASEREGSISTGLDPAGAQNESELEQTFTTFEQHTAPTSTNAVSPATPPKVVGNHVDAHGAGPSGLQTPTSGPCEAKMPVVEKKGRKQAARKQHVCSVCQKCFQNAGKLGKHQQVHGINSPFKCEHCKKSFSSKFKLVRHVLIHSDCKPFSCTICERTFHRKDHLKNHVKVHSPCKQLHVCDKCKKEYTSAISYRKHLAFHAADEGRLDCLICEQSFASKDEILYHLKVHAGSRTVKNPDEKKYSCDHCERKFFTRKDVRRHMVVHTGRRDFLCQFCPQRFGRKDHLVRHIKKSHAKSPDSEPEDASSQVVLVKTEAAECDDDAGCSASIKVECDVDAESNFSDAELNIDLDSLLALPAARSQGELADLGCAVLDVIADDEGQGSAPAAGSDDCQPPLFDGSLMTFLRDDAPENVRENAPLPAFSQIFQPPPPSQSHHQHHQPSAR